MTERYDLRLTPEQRDDRLADAARVIEHERTVIRKTDRDEYDSPEARPDRGQRLERISRAIRTLEAERDRLLADDLTEYPPDHSDVDHLLRDTMNAIQQLTARDGTADLVRLRHMLGDLGYDERHVTRAVAELEQRGEVYRPSDEPEVKPV